MLDNFYDNSKRLACNYNHVAEYINNTHSIGFHLKICIYRWALKNSHTKSDIASSLQATNSTKLEFIFQRGDG